MNDAHIKTDNCAWQWILPLPITRARITATHTLDNAKSASEFQALALDEFLIYDASSDESIDPKSFQEVISNGSVKYFAIHGSGAAIRQIASKIEANGYSIKNYSLIPPKEPRIVVPLSNIRATSIGLGLHTPGGRFARLAIFVVKKLVAVGITFPLNKRRLLVASRTQYRPWPLSTVPASEFSDCDFALYLGTGGAERKIVALPIGSTEPKQIIKTAEHPAARDRLKNEARMLRYLAGTPLSKQVPLVGHFQSEQQHSILIQQYFQSNFCRQANKERAAIDFLRTCATVNSSKVTLEEYIEDHLFDPLHISTKTTDAKEIISNLKLKFGKLNITLALTHGDFAGWNCKLGINGLFVYDWEEGNEKGIPANDAFSYIAFPLLLVEKITSARLISSKALAFAKKVYSRNEFDTPAIEASFVLWCLSLAPEFFPAIVTEMAHLVNDHLHRTVQSQ